MSKKQRPADAETLQVRRGQPKRSSDRGGGPSAAMSREFIPTAMHYQGKGSKIVLPLISSIRVSELRPGGSGEPVFVIKVTAGDKMWLVERTVSEIKSIAEWTQNYHPEARLPTQLPVWKKSALPTAAEIVDAVDRYLAQFPQFPDIVGCWEFNDMFEVERQFVPPSDPETGLLYLKLIAAKNLLPENKKEELLGATIKITTCVSIRKSMSTTSDAEYKASLISKGLESTSRDGTWLHEMAFTLLDKSRPLWVQILDRSKKIIAHGQLTTAGLEDGKLSKIKLLLSNVFAPTNAVVSKSKTSNNASSTEDPSKCKLYIAAQYTTARVRQPISWNIPPIRVQLTHSEYAPGEEVQGVLILNAPENIKAEHVVLTFLGRIKVDTSDMVDESMQTTFAHEIDLFNDSILCWSDKDRQILPAGYYVWPFRFRLPEILPPTHATYYGSVEYLVRAALYRSGALVSKKKKLDSELVVLSSNNVFNSVIKHEERPSQIMKRAVFKCGSETITVKAKLAYTPVLIGAPILMKVIVDNESQKPLKDVSVKLILNTTFRAPGRSATVSEEISTVTPLGEATIPVDSRQIIKVVLDVPSTTQPSLPSQLSSILEAQYVIQITIGGASGFSDSGDIVARMPVLLCHHIAEEKSRLKTHRGPTGAVVGDRTPLSARRKAPGAVASGKKKKVDTVDVTAAFDDGDASDDEYGNMRSDNPLDYFLPMPSSSEYTAFPTRVPSTIKTASNNALAIRNATPSPDKRATTQ